MNQFQPRGFSILPPIIKNLLIINGLFFLATYVFADTLKLDLVQMLGLYYFESELFRPYQIITHMFMHGGFWHILFNMFMLWMLGAAVENILGAKRFLIFYLLTGLGAAALHTIVNYIELSGLKNAIEVYTLNPSLEAFELMIYNTVPANYRLSFVSLLEFWQSNPESNIALERSVSYSNQLLTQQLNIPTVGASGAVYGVLLAFGFLFPNTIIHVYFVLPIKAKYFVGILMLLAVYMGFQNNPGDNIAHFAHLGGALFGYIILKYWGYGKYSRY